MAWDSGIVEKKNFTAGAVNIHDLKSMVID